MNSLVQRGCLSVLALAIVCVQIFGLQHGYVCSHGEHPVATLAPDCPTEDHHEGEPHQYLALDLQAVLAGLTSAPCAQEIAPARFTVSTHGIFPRLVRCLPRGRAAGADPPGALANLVACCCVRLV